MPEAEILDASLDAIDIFAHQSRQTFGTVELNQLAESIRSVGQLQPGVAWYDPGRSRYLLIAGERRFRALKQLNASTMTLKVIRGPMTQAQLLTINIAENLQRSGLSPIERALAFRRLMQLDDLKGVDVATRLNISTATVSRELSLLELSPALQEQIASGVLPASVGAALARLEENDIRTYIADRFFAGELSRDGVTEEVNRRLKGSKPKAAKPRKFTYRIDGFAVTLSGTSLSLDKLLKAIERIGNSAKALPEGSGIGDLIRSLKTS